MTKFTVTLESVDPMTKAEAYTQYGVIAGAMEEHEHLRLVEIVDDANAVPTPPKRKYVRKAATAANGQTPSQLDLERDALK